MKFNSDYEHELGYDRYNLKCQSYMKQIYGIQQQQKQQQQTQMHPKQIQQQTNPNIQLFTYIRDPINRFLSSLGQILNSPIGIIRRSGISPCHTTSITTMQLIHCVLTKMENNINNNINNDVTASNNDGNKNLTYSRVHDDSHSYNYYNYLDEHFVPQIYELYVGLYELDIGISIMDMTASIISNIVQQMNTAAATAVVGVQVPPPSQKQQQQRQPHIAPQPPLHELPKVNSASNGIVTNYPQFDLQYNSLSVSIKRRICKLYEIDFLMIKQINQMKMKD